MSGAFLRTLGENRIQFIEYDIAHISQRDYNTKSWDHFRTARRIRWQMQNTSSRGILKYPIMIQSSKLRWMTSTKPTARPSLSLRHTRVALSCGSMPLALGKNQRARIKISLTG